MKEKINFAGWPEWSEQCIQDLSLDDLSELKKIELFLPKNVFLTVDYDIDDEDDEFAVKDDSEMADFITEAEETMKNSADKKDYESLFGRYFLKIDGQKAVHILNWPKKDSEEKKFKELIKAGHHPFIYEVVEYNPFEDTRYGQKVGWHFPYLSYYENVFNEDDPALVSRYEVNLPVQEGCELYYDADENVLWEGENDWTDWERYEEIDAVLFEEFVTEAEKFLKEDEEIANKRQEYARQIQEERTAEKEDAD